jgi:hypothetical protein
MAANSGLDMRARVLNSRAVAVAVAAIVSVAAAGPVFAQATGGGSCAAMAAGEVCARGAVVSSCCCADAHPATPADRQAPAAGGPSLAFATAEAGWLPVAVLIPASAALAPAHGYQSVPLHTLHSARLN